MRSPPTEIDELLVFAPPANHVSHTSGLRRDQALKPDLIQQERLEEPRLIDRGRYLHEWLVREDRGTLRNGTDVAGELESRQVFQERLRKPLVAEVSELVGAERDVLYVRYGLR